jgi:hypothetical protein
MFYSLCTDTVYFRVVTNSSLLEGTLKIFPEFVHVCYLIFEDHGRGTMSIKTINVPVPRRLYFPALQ